MNELRHRARMSPDEVRAEVIADLGRFTHDPLGFRPLGVPMGTGGNVARVRGWPGRLATRATRAYRPQAARGSAHTHSGCHGQRARHRQNQSDRVAHPLVDHDARGHARRHDGEYRGPAPHEDLAGALEVVLAPAVRLPSRDVCGRGNLDPLRPKRGHERTWRIDAIPWSERNVEAFAGLHNAGKRVVLLFDEASGICRGDLGDRERRADRCRHRGALAGLRQPA